PALSRTLARRVISGKASVLGSRAPIASTQNGRAPPGHSGISERGLRLLASRDRLILAPRRAGVELARAADLLARILDHFLPLRDPADRARDREQDGEHRGREAHRLQGDARIEVDVR